MRTRAKKPEAPRYATLLNGAGYMGLKSTKTLERQIAEGRLTRYNIGRRVLIDLNELDALLRGER